VSKVGAMEVRKRLGALLDRVENGEEIVITRRGKDVARLMPVARAFDRGRAANAARELMEVSRGLSLDELRIRGLINEGRR
jgi:prevent-host-death family protein